MLFLSNDSSQRALASSPFVGTPTDTGTTSRLQCGREGMVGYLLDCYERTCQEERKVLLLFFCLFPVELTNVCVQNVCVCLFVCP